MTETAHHATDNVYVTDKLGGKHAKHSVGEKKKRKEKKKLHILY